MYGGQCIFYVFESVSLTKNAYILANKYNIIQYNLNTIQTAILWNIIAVR